MVHPEALCMYMSVIYLVLQSPKFVHLRQASQALEQASHNEALQMNNVSDALTGKTLPQALIKGSEAFRCTSSENPSSKNPWTLPLLKASR